MLFEILTGQLPFLGKSYELVVQLVNDAHPPLSDFIQAYPPALDEILSRSLAKDPAARYQSADEMGADIYAVIEVLKEEHTQVLIASARRLSAQGEYLAAQNELDRLLMSDPRNVHVRTMIRELNQHLSGKLRQQRDGLMSPETGDALHDQDFDLASAMNLLKPLTQNALYEQTLATIQSFPAHIASLPEIIELRQTAQAAWKQENIELETLGRAYATLDSSNPETEHPMSQASQSPLISQLAARYGQRRSNASDHPEQHDQGDSHPLE